jgi:hypothetical protein
MTVALAEVVSALRPGIGAPHSSRPTVTALKGRFLSGLGQRIVAARGLGEGDLPAVAHTTPQPKGTAAGYGLHSLAEAAAALEQSARTIRATDMVEGLEDLAERCGAEQRAFEESR